MTSARASRLDRRRRSASMKPTRQPAMANDSVSVSSVDAARPFAPSTWRTRRRLVAVRRRCRRRRHRGRRGARARVANATTRSHEVPLDRRVVAIARERQDHDARPRRGRGHMRPRGSPKQILVRPHRDLRHRCAGKDRRVDAGSGSSGSARARSRRAAAAPTSDARDPRCARDRVQDLAVGVELDAEASSVEVSRRPSQI